MKKYQQMQSSCDEKTNWQPQVQEGQAPLAWDVKTEFVRGQKDKQDKHLQGFVGNGKNMDFILV